MTMFPKIIQEASGTQPDLKDILARKIRDRKVQELDESAVDRQVQTERTKTAEAEAREVEAQARKINAESTIADKMVPQGVWGMIMEILKDRNPQQPMTVQDMLAILEYARAQQGGAPEAPPDGMWGFLTVMMQNMADNKQTTTPLELIELIQRVSNMGQQQPQSSTSQLIEMVNAFVALKGVFTPSAAPGTTLALPGGAAIPLEDFMKYQDHSFNLQLKAEDHKEKIANYKTVRENVPSALQAIAELAQAIKTSGGPGTQKKRQIETSQQRQPDKLPPPPPVDAGMQILQCPDCQMPFGVPADIDIEKVDVTCPKCALAVITALTKEGQANVQKPDTEYGQVEDNVEQGENPGGNIDKSPG